MDCFQGIGPNRDSGKGVISLLIGHGDVTGAQQIDHHPLWIGIVFQGDLA